MLLLGTSLLLLQGGSTAGLVRATFIALPDRIRAQWDTASLTFGPEMGSSERRIRFALTWDHVLSQLPGGTITAFTVVVSQINNGDTVDVSSAVLQSVRLAPGPAVMLSLGNTEPHGRYDTTVTVTLNNGQVLERTLPTIYSRP